MFGSVGKNPKSSRPSGREIRKKKNQSRRIVTDVNIKNYRIDATFSFHHPLSPAATHDPSVVIGKIYNTKRIRNDFTRRSDRGY